MTVKALIGRARGLIRVEDLQKVLSRVMRSARITTLTTTTSTATNSAVTGIFSKTATWSEGTSALNLKSVTATKALAGGATEVITLGIPAGAVLVAAQIRNNTLLVLGGGGVSYTAAYSGGATQTIAAGVALTKNTKAGKFFTIQGAGEADNITSNTTNITLTPNAGTLTSGTVEATVFYYDLTAPGNVA
jgi:hypothetical protein